MIRSTVCLLLCTATYAQHYASPGAPSSVPMDFNDDIYNRDMRIQPSSNFVFNFEQARRDQPLQVEMREENLGKYMGRPRITTTPSPSMPKLSEQHVPEIETVHLHHLSDMKPVPAKPYVPQNNWDPVSSHLPATLPPAPTTPKWMDLSDESFRHHSHHKPSRRPVNTYHPAPTQAPLPQWTPPAESYIEERAQHPQMSYSNPMPQYAPRTEHFRHEESHPRTSSRGSHKFSWSDVGPSAPTTPTPTPAPAAPAAGMPRNGPPPALPTLSSWYGDSFGK